jgi:hypothetical protein
MPHTSRAYTALARRVCVRIGLFGDRFGLRALPSADHALGDNNAIIGPTVGSSNCAVAEKHTCAHNTIERKCLDAPMLNPECPISLMGFI